MKILLTAATEMEMNAIHAEIPAALHVDRLVTGVGMIATAHSITRKIAHSKYDLAINFGIAGSFKKDIRIGEVVFITEDFLSELGAEDGADFLTLDQIGLEGISRIKSDFKGAEIDGLRRVKSITVNTVHGNVDSIRKIVSRLDPDIETMEGAAFSFVCQQERTDFLQIRAISNYVEKRNREEWNIPFAIENISAYVNQLLKKFAK
jgi:futalosine hydrolase